MPEYFNEYTKGESRGSGTEREGEFYFQFMCLLKLFYTFLLHGLFTLLVKLQERDPEKSFHRTIKATMNRDKVQLL